MEKKHLLLVNPWIHDFAAYNLWTRPYGFITFASFLEQNNVDFDYIDLLHITSEEADVFNLSLPSVKTYSQGKFFEETIEKPSVYNSINRIYRRFGLPPEYFRNKLSSIQKPDAVFISSGMTYWYRGVFETISVLREFFSDVPIILGGNYATLCKEHAVEYSGADLIISGSWENALDTILSFTGIDENSVSFPHDLCAANHLYKDSGFAVIRFSNGCPFRCSYCASSYISGTYRMRAPDNVADEIMLNLQDGKTDIAVYDDALLVNADELLVPVLEQVISSGYESRFHTPNGLHSRFVDEKIAGLFFRSDFKTVRLSFESVSGTAYDASDGKVGPSDLKKALGLLFAAGYTEGDIDVYILIGIPEQTDDSVYETADYVHALGGNIKTAQYSPLPHTSFFKRDSTLIPGLEQEPLLQNSTIAPGWGFDLDRYDNIKNYVRNLNNKLR